MSAFLPRALSVAVPLLTYAALGLLAWGFWQSRRLLDRWVLPVVVLALLASFAIVEDVTGSSSTRTSTSRLPRTFPIFPWLS